MRFVPQLALVLEPTAHMDSVAQEDQITALPDNNTWTRRILVNCLIGFECSLSATATCPSPHGSLGERSIAVSTHFTGDTAARTRLVATVHLSVTSEVC